jgi:hypothetical protein
MLIAVIAVYLFVGTDEAARETYAYQLSHVTIKT